MGLKNRLSDIQVGVLTVFAILVLTVGMLWFKNIKLSDYKGNWVVICFYPGDFTFV